MKHQGIDKTSLRLPRVRLHARLVPNGAARARARAADGCPARTCEDEKLRATLLLVPELVTGDDPGGVPFHCWPGAVHARLKQGVRVLVQPACAGAGAAHLSGSAARRDLRFSAPGLARLTDPRDIEALCDIWAGSLWRELPEKPAATAEDWTVLAKRVTAALSGGSVTSTRMGEAQQAAPDPDLYGADGQMAPVEHAARAVTTNVVAALDIRHADIAVALEDQRADALCASLRVACAGGSKPAAQPLTREDETEDETFWTGEPRHRATPETTPDVKKRGQINALLRAIAGLKPRGKDEAFETYVARLAKGSKRSADLVARYLREEVLVIAELRRRRKSGERTALYTNLTGARGASAETYKTAAASLCDQRYIRPAPPQWSQSAVTPARRDGQKDNFETITAAARYANWPQYRQREDTEDAPSVPAPDPRLEDAMQCFFTMQSTPTLARAAMLAIDLELDLGEGDATADLAGIGTYAHLRAALDADLAAQGPKAWTLTRMVEFDRDGCFHFWPVSREEADCRAEGQAAPASGTARHFGGLMVMGFGAGTDPTLSAPRFDITSLDVRTAVELEIQRRSIARANIEAEQELADLGAGPERQGAPRAARVAGIDLPPGVNLPCSAVDIEDEGDRQDVGLTLLDRGICAQAIRQMAARDAKLRDRGSAALCNDQGQTALVLDAEDLITGYRLYVGTPGASCTRWHPMMARAITFGTSGPSWRHAHRIEHILGVLVGKSGSAARVALDSAAMNVPGRMLPKSRAPHESGVEPPTLDSEAVFEQAVSVWDGGPMGVDCSPDEGAGNTIGDAMIFGRTLSVPRGAAHAIPRLRYGRPYRFALAAVFAGGHSVAVEDFPAEDAAEDLRADLFYPSHRMTQAAQAQLSAAARGTPPVIEPFVRALRQARIGAPQVLMPEGHARRVNGPMGPDKSGLMVVRSLDTDDKNPKDRKFTTRGQPATARRVIVIPSIPLARAAAHMGQPDNLAGATEKANLGVFDNLAATPTTWGGLRLVRQQKGGGGFPALKTSYLKGLNGVQHFDRRHIEDAPSDRTLTEGTDFDGSVFAAGSAPDSAYYPDPAAESLALRLRLRGTGARWLTMHDSRDAAPLDPIDLIAGHSYPERRRVLVTLARDTPRAGDVPDVLSSFVTLNLRRQFDPAHQGDSDRNGRFQAREVRLRLAPHEWADVEFWLLPSAKRLARDFAVLQTLAIRLSQHCKPVLAAEIADMCDGAGLCLPPNVAEEVLESLKEARGGRAFFGTGGVGAPPMAALLALAEAVRRCMIRHPIPEIAAVTRLEAVHAANRATTAPEITALSGPAFPAAVHVPPAPEPRDGPEPLRAFRPDETLLAPQPEAAAPEPEAESCATPAGRDTSLPVCDPVAAPIKVASQGSTALVLSGDVTLDLNQIDTIEVRAAMAFPGSSGFDDRLRGRSLALRRRGWWPLVDNPSGADPDQATDAPFRGSQSLFGFRVHPDGATSFDTAEVTLLRAEDLPRPGQGACQRFIKLRRLFEARDIGDVRITERHIFPDGKARRMKVWINGLPRSAQFMRTADRKLRSGDPWVAAEGLHYEVGDLIKGEDLRAEAQCRLSEPVEVVLPATIRPAKPDALAPLPGFQHEVPAAATRDLDRLEHRRRSVIRIPLGREWFSSGEDERLGIVLWPPHIGPEDNWNLSRNRITLRRSAKYGGDREIDLNDLRRYRLTRRKLVDILCAPKSDTPNGAFVPFEDGHLGPGGRFVSRRGADPVREGKPHRQIFFAPGDFPDLDLAPGDPRRAELVTAVEMPLSDDQGEGGRDRAKADPSPPMLVSLVTYAPRFDPELEHWYVDVTLEDSDAAETFVRLGLVRYQPHTVADLRCSRPVRQFVQPLPDRIADVSRYAPVARACAGDSGIRVRLCGPSYYRRQVSKALFDLIDPGGLSAGAWPPDLLAGTDCKPDATAHVLSGQEAAPRMKVTLFRNGVDAGNRPYRETVPIPVSAIGRAHHLLLPADHDVGVLSSAEICQIDPAHRVQAGSVMVKPVVTRSGEAVWVLKIPDTVLGGYEGLEVQVEEVEAFEPATPPTWEDLERQPVPSRIDPTPPPSRDTAATGHPGAPATGLHLSGARMRAVFDLSGWAGT